MRNREHATPEPQPKTLRVVEFRRREAPSPQAGTIERKLQADVAAWLKQRRSSR